MVGQLYCSSSDARATVNWLDFVLTSPADQAGLVLRGVFSLNRADQPGGLKMGTVACWAERVTEKTPAQAEV